MEMLLVGFLIHFSYFWCEPFVLLSGFRHSPLFGDGTGAGLFCPHPASFFGLKC